MTGTSIPKNQSQPTNTYGRRRHAVCGDRGDRHQQNQ